MIPENQTSTTTYAKQKQDAGVPEAAVQPAMFAD